MVGDVPIQERRYVFGDLLVPPVGLDQDTLEEVVR